MRMYFVPRFTKHKDPRTLSQAKIRTLTEVIPRYHPPLSDLVHVADQDYTGASEELMGSGFPLQTLFLVHLKEVP